MMDGMPTWLLSVAIVVAMVSFVWGFVHQIRAREEFFDSYPDLYKGADGKLHRR